MAGEAAEVAFKARNAAQRGHNGVVITAGEIGAAAGSGKESIAAEEDIVYLQADRAFAVAGGGVSWMVREPSVSSSPSP